MEFNVGDDIKALSTVQLSDKTELFHNSYYETPSPRSSQDLSAYELDSQIETSQELFSEVQLHEHWKVQTDESKFSLIGHDTSLIGTFMLDSANCIRNEYSATSVIDTEMLDVGGNVVRAERRQMAEWTGESPNITLPNTDVHNESFSSLSEVIDEVDEGQLVLLEQAIHLLKQKNSHIEKMIQQGNSTIEERKRKVKKEVEKMHATLDTFEDKLEQEFKIIGNHSKRENAKLDKVLALEESFAEVGRNCASLMNLFPELDKTARNSTQNLVLAENILHMAGHFDQFNGGFPADGGDRIQTAEMSSAVAQLQQSLKAINSSVFGPSVQNSETAKLVRDTMDHLTRIERLYIAEFPPMSLFEYEMEHAMDASTTSASYATSDLRSVKSVDGRSLKSELDSQATQAETTVDFSEESRATTTPLETALSRIASQVKTALDSFGSSSAATPLRTARDLASPGFLLARAVKSETDILRTALQNTEKSEMETAQIPTISRWASATDIGGYFTDSTDRSMYLSKFNSDFEGDLTSSTGESSAVSFPSCTMVPMRPTSDVLTALAIDDSLSDIMERTQLSHSLESVH